MLQNYSKYRVLQEFFDFPRKSFQIREISRRIRLAQISVTNHVKALIEEKLIVKDYSGIYPSLRASRDNDDFKLLKKQNLVWRLYKSGFLGYIEKETRPDCIVLFGSASRGEDTENSDIDIFVQSKETRLDLGKYEKMLNRKINILFEPDIKELSKELINNMVNGQVLHGYLRVL